MKYYTLLLLLLLTFGCSEETYSASKSDEGIDRHIYYGDILNDEVLVIDMKKMELVDAISSSGHYPYEVTQGPNEDIYILNRDDFNIGIIDGLNITDTINIPLKPRSISIKGDNILLTSTNEAAAVIISNSTSSAFYSDSSYKLPASFGGKNATGHPFWINESYFLLLDRTENSIELYKKGTFEPISKLITSSSVHHIMKQGDYYYGICEGVQNGSAPSVIQFDVAYDEIKFYSERFIDSFDETRIDLNSSTWGAHHGAIHPDGKHLYFGSQEGNVFVLALPSLKLVDNFKAGKGVGHLIFSHTLLITTNHHDNFKNFYDASNPEKNVELKKLFFSTQESSGFITQSHTAHVINDYLYFMYNESNSSTFFKVSLKDQNDIHIEDQLNLPNRRANMGTTLKHSTYTTSDM